MKHTIPLWVIACMLFACTSHHDRTEANNQIEASSTESVESDANEFILPQPVSLANSFKNAGLSYHIGKTNPTANKNQYALKIDQLLNLGVYTADLTYCALNKKSQEARAYLMTIQELGVKVGLKSVFSDKTTIDRFDRNLDSPDSLEAIIYTIQDKSDNFLEDNDLKYLAAVEFAGAWAEGMYLGIEDVKQKGAVGSALVDQMVLLENTIKGLKKHPSKNDKRLQEVIQQFESVFRFYNQLPSIVKASKNNNFQTPKLSSSELDQLVDKITHLRTFIVSPA